MKEQVVMPNLTTHATEAKAIAAATKMGLTEAEAKSVVEHVGMTYQLDADKAERVLVARKSEHLRTVAEPHADATLVESAADLDMIQATGYSHCPHCGINLDNGVTDFDGMVDCHGSEAAALKLMNHEWSCLGCGGEWGPEIARKGAAKARTIPLRHYTNKSEPTLKEQGGAVKVCWDLFIANPDMKRKDAIQAAVDKGVAFYTARTQYQKWFKAHNADKAGR
jgi:hypothetical protein